jgi:multidrug resistance efflux pump
MVIDPSNYAIAVRQAEAAVDQASAVAVTSLLFDLNGLSIHCPLLDLALGGQPAKNAQVESDRRQKQTDLSVSAEDQQTFASNAQSSNAAYRLAVANLDQARANLKRTQLLSPVDGYVTNLLTQLGNYANVGERSISVVKADSFWVDGYFEETISSIRKGDPAIIKLIGYSQIVGGHVDSVARGINVANAQPDLSGLASVNPIFTWVCLAQRVPVRIHLDQVPDGVRLAAGMTATVQIDSRPRH